MNEAYIQYSRKPAASNMERGSGPIVRNLPLSSPQVSS